MKTSNLLLVITTVCTALMAGLFYAYSCSVVLAVGTLPDAEYIAAMQSINRAIQNPVFFTGFFGAPILLCICTYKHYTLSATLRFWLLLAATVIYLTGALGTTIFGNIPLNTALEKISLLNATKEDIHLQRVIFEIPWKNLNIIRTVASILALLLVIIACVYTGKK